MNGPCPLIGFTGVTDINTYGSQPTIGLNTTVVATLHNLSPANYSAQPGQVLFRWRPLGWNGDNCSTPVLVTALNSVNPAEAINNGNVMIPPGGSLPATIIWTPGAGDVGNSGAKGQIFCQGTALYDVLCPAGCPPDCTSMPYNLLSGRVNVLGPGSLSEPAPAARAATMASRATPVYLGFAIANTSGIALRLRVSVQPLGPNGIPPENVRFELGKARLRIAAGKPTVLNQSFYAGAVPRRIFEELVNRDENARESFGVESGELRQGLFEIAVPEKLEASASIMQVDYEIAGDGPLAGKTFGSFTIDVGEHLRVMRDLTVRRDEGKGKK